MLIICHETVNASQSVKLVLAPIILFCIESLLNPTDARTSGGIEPNPPPGAESTTTDASVTVSVHTGGCKVRLMVLPVRVYDEDLTKFVDTYGFLDSGSELT